MATRTTQPQPRRRRRLSPVPTQVSLGGLLIIFGAAHGSGVPIALGVLFIITAALVGVTR